MPYPESCPECGSAFRNTGTHFTARRNEVGRHVLLELGCQNTTRRFWWDFTTGRLTDDGRAAPARRAAHLDRVHVETNGHLRLATLEPVVAEEAPEADITIETIDIPAVEPAAEPEVQTILAEVASLARAEHRAEAGHRAEGDSPGAVLSSAAPSADTERPAEVSAEARAMKDAFIRQLQLDRLTLRQMRAWVMSDESRRAVEVAAGATEATYERLALILFGSELPELLGRPQSSSGAPGMTAEERLELQREKARIRARQRRAAAKAARQQT